MSLPLGIVVLTWLKHVKTCHKTFIPANLDQNVGKLGFEVSFDCTHSFFLVTLNITVIFVWLPWWASQHVGIVGSSTEHLFLHWADEFRPTTFIKVVVLAWDTRFVAQALCKENTAGGIFKEKSVFFQWFCPIDMLDISVIDVVYFEFDWWLQHHRNTQIVVTHPILRHGVEASHTPVITSWIFRVEGFGVVWVFFIEFLCLFCPSEDSELGSFFKDLFLHFLYYRLFLFSEIQDCQVLLSQTFSLSCLFLCHRQRNEP